MKLQKKPNLIVYSLGSLIEQIHTKLFHHLKKKGEKPKGPALILANHASFQDWKFIVSVCGFRRVTFMCTYHFFTFKFLAFWLKLLGIIPKYQFTTDLTSMKKVKYVVQHGGMVYVAPEGTVYANGKLGYISQGTAKLIKFLKVPVYTANIEGAGLGCAKWSKKKHKNYVTVTVNKIIEANEIAELSNEDILQKVRSSLSYNEYNYRDKNNILIQGNDLAEGFESMFYKCPVCGSEFTLTTKGNTVTCFHCNSEAELGADFKFIWNTDKQYFDNYIDWYDWQYQCLKDEISSQDFCMSEEVDYGINKDGVNNYIKVGHGVLSLSHSGWDYNGTFDGKPFTDHDDISQVFLATLKCGVHFELPFKDGHCRVFYPENGNRAMKWHLASRAITELYKS